VDRNLSILFYVPSSLYDKTVLTKSQTLQLSYMQIIFVQEIFDYTPNTKFHPNLSTTSRHIDGHIAPFCVHFMVLLQRTHESD